MFDAGRDVDHVMAAHHPALGAEFDQPLASST